MLTCYLGPMDGAQVDECKVSPDGYLSMGIQEKMVTVSDTVAKQSMRISVWEWCPGYEAGAYLIKYKLVEQGTRRFLRYVRSAA